LRLSYTEKEYEELLYLDIASYEVPGIQAVGIGPYYKDSCEQTLFQSQLSPISSGPPVLIQSLPFEEPSNSKAHSLSTTYQTFTPYYTLPAGNPLSRPGKTRFPTYFLFTAPTSGETTSFPEIAGFGDWLIPPAVYYEGIARVDSYIISEL